MAKKLTQKAILKEIDWTEFSVGLQEYIVNDYEYLIGEVVWETAIDVIEQLQQDPNYKELTDTEISEVAEPVRERVIKEINEMMAKGFKEIAKKYKKL